MNVNDKIFEINPNAIILEPHSIYNLAIAGLCLLNPNRICVAYDVNRLEKLLFEHFATIFGPNNKTDKEKWNEIEDWVNYNIINGYYGRNTPVFVYFEHAVDQFDKRANLEVLFDGLEYLSEEFDEAIIGVVEIPNGEQRVGYSLKTIYDILKINKKPSFTFDSQIVELVKPFEDTKTPAIFIELSNLL